MSNLNKAERVIAKHLGSSDPYSITAGQAAESLEAAGLLAPDLPEPGSNHSPSWGVVHFDREKQVIKIGINGVLARTPKVAREWAYGLLAAANYAEKEQDNE